MSELAGVTQIFGDVWGLIMNFKLGSFPVIYAILGITVLGILVKFVKGKK